jgi:hypothetical protein
MKQLILHIGFSKTATSSIQQTLYNNPIELGKTGYVYPTQTISNKQLVNHFTSIITSFSSNPEALPPTWRRNLLGLDLLEAINSFEKQLEVSLQTNKNVILSGENISRLSQDELVKLKFYLVSHGFKIKVMCYVRRPYAFYCSSVQQYIKAGGARAKALPVVSKSKEITKVLAVFDEVMFHSFEEACMHQCGPVGHFLDNLNLNYNNFDIVSKNEGISNITARLYAHINNSFPRYKNGKSNSRARSKKIYNLAGPKFLLIEEELSEVRESLDNENTSLKRLLGANYCDEHYSTSSDFTLNLEESLYLYMNCTQPSHVTQEVLKFIDKHTVFDLERIIIGDPENCRLIRDISIYYESIDLSLSYRLMKKAYSISPEKHLINKKLKIYENRLKRND